MCWQGDSHIVTTEFVYGTDFKDTEAAVGCEQFEACILYPWKSAGDVLAEVYSQFLLTKMQCEVDLNNGKGMVSLNANN
ncbi:hypothetical protein V6N13_079405 [Hibiscus sabdariffa]|uniref:Uncharacterized protein n=1 Tax=Hibiscus sabdariffa TaxID=183260 RepID=A0ABR2RRS6_9ROSI